MPTIKKYAYIYNSGTTEMCVMAKYGLWLVCREVKRLENAGV